jgi:hypothetical protein
MIDTNPFEAVVSIQQTTLEQTHEALTESMDAQKDLVDSIVDNLESIERAQQQGTELSREALLASIDSIETVNPDADIEDLRSGIEAQFDTFEQSHESQWDAITELTEQSRDSFEETADTYAEMVDSSFEQFLDAHEQVGEQAADATEQTIEATTELTEETSQAS